MKKYFLFTYITLFLLYPSINLYANFWDSYTDYYENNHWGVLENLLDDCANHTITTDECIFIGLNTLKMLNSNNDEDIDSIPLKYKISKKSIHKGPYFFIDFIYSNEKSLSDKTLNAFLNSGWCDYEYYNALVKNDNVKKYFVNSKIKTIEFTDIINNLVNDKVITTSVAMILINGRPIKLYPIFF